MPTRLHDIEPFLKQYASAPVDGRVEEIRRMFRNRGPSVLDRTLAAGDRAVEGMQSDQAGRERYSSPFRVGGVDDPSAIAAGMPSDFSASRLPQFYGGGGGQLDPETEMRLADMGQSVSSGPYSNPRTAGRWSGSEHPAIAATRAANQGMGGAGVVAPQGGGSYVAGGIQQAPSDRTGVASAVRTGDAFLDVNTNFPQLAAEKAIYDNNEKAFSQANEARLGSIAGDRERADAQRAAKLAAGFSAEGMPETEIANAVKLRMNPRLAYQPPSPEMQAAAQRDAAERQGRSNLHAIAAKFRRNGMPPAMAYTMAMNTMNTTNQDGPNVGGTLPPIDPQRLAMMNPQGGMAAGQYGVGMGRNQVESDRAQMEYGARNNETEAGREKGVMEMALAAQELRQKGQRNKAEIKLMKKAGGLGDGPMKNLRDLMDLIKQGTEGGLFDGNPGALTSAQQAVHGMLQGLLPGGGQGAMQTIPPGNQGAQPTIDPAALNRQMAKYPAGEQEGRRYATLAGQYGGTGDVDFGAAEYARRRYEQADPNLLSFVPDVFINPVTRRQMASEWLQRELGYAAPAADKISQGFFR
jgi:hypothetical protein